MLGWRGNDTGGWEPFERNMNRVFPGVKFFDMELTHPIFHAFFEINTLENFPQAYNSGRPVFKGVYQDNDPSKRLLMIVNYNTDISQFWEWSGRGLRPVDDTNEAYKLGVNYLFYGMTHYPHHRSAKALAERRFRIHGSRSAKAFALRATATGPTAADGGCVACSRTPAPARGVGPEAPEKRHTERIGVAEKAGGHGHLRQAGHRALLTGARLLAIALQPAFVRIRRARLRDTAHIEPLRFHRVHEQRPKRIARRIERGGGRAQGVAGRGRLERIAQPPRADRRQFS